jgi:hypothetical protein
MHFLQKFSFVLQRYRLRWAVVAALGLAAIPLSAAMASPVMYDNFNHGISPLWLETAGGSLSTDCGSVGGQALYFRGNGNYYVDRHATTVPLDVTFGGSVQFWLRIGTGSYPCEEADNGEDVVLEYSTPDTPWTELAKFKHNEYPYFRHVTVAIPAEAQTAATQFRWRQLDNSGDCCDHWALDNVAIGDAWPEDGRMNPDPSAPIVIYPGPPIEVWAVDPNISDGVEAFTITQEAINAVGVPTDGPAVIYSGLNPITYRPITVYRLTTGEVQINTYYADGKPYVVNWNIGDTFVTTLDW